MHAQFALVLEDGTTVETQLAPFLAFGRGVRVRKARAVVLFRLRIVLSWACVAELGPFRAGAGVATLGAYTVVASLSNRTARVDVLTRRTASRTLASEIVREKRTRARAERAIALLAARTSCLPPLAWRRVLHFVLAAEPASGVT
jgi:hypothetical protein